MQNSSSIYCVQKGLVYLLSERPQLPRADVKHSWRCRYPSTTPSPRCSGSVGSFPSQGRSVGELLARSPSCGDASGSRTVSNRRLAAISLNTSLTPAPALQPWVSASARCPGLRWCRRRCSCCWSRRSWRSSSQRPSFFPCLNNSSTFLYESSRLKLLISSFSKASLPNLDTIQQLGKCIQRFQSCSRNSQGSANSFKIFLKSP